MGADRPEHGWRVVGVSERGAAHLRTGLPNQDALLWLPESGSDLPLSVAAADGHGGAKCFRSNLGSRFGAEVATQLLQEFLNSWNGTNLSAMKRTAEELLPRELVRRWVAAVEKHAQQSPFTPEELGAVEQRDGARARQAVESNPLLAYGTTLLAVAVTGGFIVYLQIGDGDILAVSPGGEVMRPLPGDERLFANETTSLCSPDAWREFRAAFQVVAGCPPALITLSTDGYSNCFASDKDFLQVGSDLLGIVRSGGRLARQGLQAQLAQASRNYSGDDITVAVVCSPGACRPAESPNP